MWSRATNKVKKQKNLEVKEKKEKTGTKRNWKRGRRKERKE
jgi:hypothetical protein